MSELGERKSQLGGCEGCTWRDVPGNRPLPGMPRMKAGLLGDTAVLHSVGTARSSLLVSPPASGTICINGERRAVKPSDNAKFGPEIAAKSPTDGKQDASKPGVRVGADARANLHVGPFDWPNGSSVDTDLPQQSMGAGPSEAVGIDRSRGATTVAACLLYNRYGAQRPE